MVYYKKLQGDPGFYQTTKCTTEICGSFSCLQKLAHIYLHLHLYGCLQPENLFLAHICLGFVLSFDYYSPALIVPRLSAKLRAAPVSHRSNCFSP